MGNLYDFVAMRNDGYTDSDILSALHGEFSTKYNVDAMLKDGYSAGDILNAISPSFTQPVATEPPKESGYSDALKMGWERFKTGAEVPLNKVGLISDEELASDVAADTSLASSQNRPTYLKPIEEQVQRTNEAEGVGATAWEMAKLVGTAITNPKATGYLFTENAANQISSLGGMAGGALAGSMVGGIPGALVGLAGGALIGNSPEYGGKVVEMVGQEAQKLGIDPSDPKNVLRILNDETFRSEAERHGLVKWGIISAVDTVTGGLVGRGLNTAERTYLTAQKSILSRHGADIATAAANPVARAELDAAKQAFVKTQTFGARAARGASAVGAEMFSEGGGEFLGEGLASGEWKPGDATLEGVLALGQSIGEAVVTGKAFKPSQLPTSILDKVISEIPGSPEVNAAINKTLGASDSTLTDALNNAPRAETGFIDQTPTGQREFGALSQGTTGIGAVNELADLAAQERADVEQRRAGLISQQGMQRESSLESADARVVGAQAAETRTARLNLLDTTYANPDERSPGMTFLQRLAEQFPNNPNPTSEEKQIIAKREGAYQAFNSTEPTLPAEQIPEPTKQTGPRAPEAQISQVDEYLANGYRPIAGGKMLANSKGKKLILSTIQKNYIKDIQDGKIAQPVASALDRGIIEGGSNQPLGSTPDVDVQRGAVIPAGRDGMPGTPVAIDAAGGLAPVAAGAGGEALAPTFKTEMTGSHNGQTDHVIHARTADGKSGKLEYTLYKGIPQVSMIDVPEASRRAGIGQSMAIELQRQFPDVEIVFGMLTDDGSKLYQSLNKKTVPSEYDAAFTELDAAKSEWDSLLKKVDEFHAIENPTKAQRDKFESTIAPINSLHDRIYELENELQGKKPTKVIIQEQQPATPIPAASADGKVIKKLYHGTPFSQRGVVGSGGGELGAGLYVSEDKSIANDYTRTNEELRSISELSPKVFEFDASRANLKQLTKAEYLRDRSEQYAIAQSENNGEWTKEVANRGEAALIAKYESEGFDGVYATDEKQGVIFKNKISKLKGLDNALQKQEAQAAEAVAPQQSPATPIPAAPASAPKPDVSTTGTIKELSDGRHAAVGFTPEQLRAADPKVFIDGKGNGIFPAKTNKIQLESAPGISKIPEGTILADGDKPFGKRKQAAMVIATTKGMSKTHKVIPLDDGGYGIAQRIKETKGEVERIGESVMHKDAGEPAEIATPAVVEKSLLKGDAKSKLTLAQMKDRLIGEVESAISKATETPEIKAYQDAVKAHPENRTNDSWMSDRNRQEMRNKIGYITFDVPGDGVFRVLNTAENLESFRSKIGGAFKAVGKRKEETRAPLDRPAGEMSPQAYVNQVMKDNYATAEDFKNAIEAADMNNIDTAELVKRHGELSVMEADAKTLGIDTNGKTHKQIEKEISERFSATQEAEPPTAEAGNVKPADPMTQMAETVKSLAKSVQSLVDSQSKPAIAPDDVQDVVGKPSQSPKAEPASTEGGNVTSSSVNQSRLENHDPTPEESNKVQSGIEGGTAADAARFIIETSDNESYRMIAGNVLSRILELEAVGVKFNLHVAHAKDQVDSRLVGVRGFADTQFDSNETDIWVQGADMTGQVGTSYETVLHELVHAVTQSAVHLGYQENDNTSLGAATLRLYKVYFEILKHGESKLTAYRSGNVTLTDFEEMLFRIRGANNATQTVHEIIAWGLTNKSFQGYLEGIPYSADQNMWDRFVQAIRSFLGLPAKADTALSEVLDIGNKMLNEPIINLLKSANKVGISLTYNTPRGGIYNATIKAVTEGGVSNQDDIHGYGITKSQAENLAERAFNVWRKDLGGEGFRTWREMLASEDGADDLGDVVYNESELYDRFTKLVSDYGGRNEDVSAKDVFNALKSGELSDGFAQRTVSKEIPIAETKAEKLGSLGEPSLYPAISAEEQQSLFDIAIQRQTKSNHDEVAAARYEVFMRFNTSSLDAIAAKDVLAKLKTWSNYPKSATNMHALMNGGKPVESQWFGILNMSYLSQQNVTAGDVDAFVQSVSAPDKSWNTPDGERLRHYISRTLLGIDTRIEYKDLKFIVESTLKPLGQYSNLSRSITIRANSANTVAHEIGHYLDYKWMREAYPQGAGTATNKGLVKKGVITAHSSALREQWMTRFAEFAQELTDGSEIGSAYLQDRKEVFARFVDRFVSWTAKHAGVREFDEARYSDKFTDSQFMKFVRLLQEKAYVDIVDGNPNGKSDARTKDVTETRQQEGNTLESRSTGNNLPAIESAMKRRGIRGDDLLDAMDLADDIIAGGGVIRSDGMVELYHRTTPEAASQIIKTGTMTGKEDRLFFGTNATGQIDGYGNAAVKVLLPLEKLELNDVFNGEAHITIITNGKPLRVTAERVTLESRAPTFYSQLSRAIESAPDKVFGQAQMFKLWLLNNAPKLGIKKDEIQWTAITDFLDLKGKEKVSKADVLEYLKSGGVRVEEKTLSDVKYKLSDSAISDDIKTLNDANVTVEYDGDNYDGTQRNYPVRFIEHMGRSKELHEGMLPAKYFNQETIDAADRVNSYLRNAEKAKTKFATYVPPGGKPGTYRELLLTLPTETAVNWDGKTTRRVGKFLSTHYPDSPNLVAHLRVDEVAGANGERLLRVIEAQGDFGQQGEEKGFVGQKPADEKRLAEFKEKLAKETDEGKAASLTKTIAKIQKRVDKNDYSIPVAPFVTDTGAWVSLTIKKAIAYAAEQGMDGIVFATGQQNADFYDLSKSVDRVEWYPVNEAGIGDLQAFKGGESVIFKHRIYEKELPDLIGKDAAEKLINNPTDKTPGRYGNTHTISGEALKVGGTGMLKFYGTPSTLAADMQSKTPPIVPLTANKVLKQIGADMTVSTIELADIPESEKKGDKADWEPTLIGFAIPDSLRAKALQGLPLFSRRIHSDRPTAHDYIVPETPEFDGNMSGDLGYIPAAAEKKGVEALPIRLTVGVSRGAHSGFGVMHISDTGDKFPARSVPEYTGDKAENIARHIAMLARSFNQIYAEAGRVIVRSGKSQEALVLERRTDADTGEGFYSVITLRPAEKNVWGNPVWVGRLTLPTNEPQQLGASTLSDDQKSLQSPRYGQRNQTERFDVTQTAVDSQPKKQPTVTTKKRRTFTMKDVNESRERAEITNRTTAQVRAELVKSIGKTTVANLEAKGLLKIVANANSLPRGVTISPMGTALYDGETAYIIADRSQPNDSLRMVLHEIGAHHGLENMLGEKGYKALTNRIQMMNKMGNKRVRAAYAFVNNNYPELELTNPDHMREVLANLGQDADIQKQAWWKEVIKAVRRFLAQQGFTGIITDKDIQDMVVYSLKSAAKAERETGGRLATAMASKVGETAYKPVDTGILESRVSQAIKGASASQWIASAEIKNETASKARDWLSDSIMPTEKGHFNWWHKTVGTQLHKARVNPDFGKVFDIAQKFMSDITMFAQRAESFAPSILPRSDSIAGLFNQKAWKEFKAGNPLSIAKVLNTGLGEEDNRLVADALNAGTLENGADPRTGVVWTDAQLKSKFNMTPEQIGYYREARAVIDQSLDDMALAEIIRDARIAKVDERLLDGLAQVSAPLDRVAAVLDSTLGKMRDRMEANGEDILHVMELQGRIRLKVKDNALLKKSGYAPLMRFGKYTVSGFDNTTQEPVFFMFESKSEALRAEIALKGDTQMSEVERNELNEEKFKLFKGISPSTIETFANNSELAHDPVFQDYLKMAVANRSAMKRMIHRKGIVGFNNDATRTLAAFVLSNSRSASNNLNAANISAAVLNIKEGDVQQEATKLVEYINNPTEEAAKLRGFMFFQYLGGSLAAGLVNMTQPVLMTFPYLSQFGVKNSAQHMATGLKDTSNWFLHKDVKDADLQAALEKAQGIGITAPQEIFQMIAAAQGSAGSLAGHKFMRMWGANFAITEAFNRVLTFSAAYRVGREMTPAALKEAGFKDAFEFAERAVEDTQGIYNKGNRPNWGRGAIGATVFTFKQYSIAYMEFMKRMWGTGKIPKKQFVVATTMLILAAGLSGLPGADDLDDIIETVGHWLGYATNSKKWKHEVLTSLLGEDAANFALYGVSTLPFMPLDVQGRLGMQNLIPGTGMFNPVKKEKAREITEVVGIAGSFAKTTLESLDYAAKGNLTAAAKGMLPKTFKDAYQAYEMATTGEYRDVSGRKVMEATGGDAIVKAIGFQPSEIARESRAMNLRRADIEIHNAKADELNGKIARAIVDKDPEARAEAMKELRQWNLDNPELRIKYNPVAIKQRVNKMRATRMERFIKATPQTMRSEMKAALND